MKAAKNWEHSKSGRKFTKSIERKGRQVEKEWKQFENSPEVDKAKGEVMKEFAELEKGFNSAISSKEGKAAIRKFEDDMRFVERTLEEAR